MNDLQKLASDRAEVENEVYTVLARYMGEWWNTKTEVPNADAEKLAFVIGAWFVDWALVQKGILRDKNKNIVKQEDPKEEKREGGGE